VHLYSKHIFCLFFLLIAASTPSLAAPAIDEVFDPGDFTAEEVGIIQRSLTFLGYYDGLWDKEWGDASQSALEDYSLDEFDQRKPLNGFVVTAVIEALDVADRIGWVEVPVEAAGISFGIPERYVQFVDSDNAVEFSGAGLMVRFSFSSRWDARQLHRGTERRNSSGRPYTVRRSQRLVTSVREGDSLVYVRSDSVGGQWVTLEIESSVGNSELLSYVSSSFDTSADFDVSDGDLRNILAIIEEVAAISEGSGSVSPDSDSGSLPGDSSGTGFFVTPSLAVTNAHVVEGCRAISTPSGEELSIRSKSDADDLALLTYSGSSNAVLPISVAGDVGLGEEVSALGYPLYGTLSRQLNFTSGVVSAMAGLGDKEDHFTLTAPIQPGNSGGPILNQFSQVVGVAVATLDAARLAAEQKFVPQNINYAIKGGTLRDFLEDNKVQYGSDPIKPERRGAVPTRVQRAVIPIICETEGNRVAAVGPDFSGGQTAGWYLAEFGGLDFYGGDIRPSGREVSSLRQCQQQCADDLNCRLYTYNTRYQMCFIKSDYTLAQSHPDAQSGLIFPADSAEAAPQFPVKWQLHQGRTFAGESYRALSRPDYQSCIAECENETDCSAFTYAPNQNVRQCILFRDGPGRLTTAPSPETISGESVSTVVEPDHVTFLGTRQN